MDDYWIPGQRMMGDIKFLDSLRAFDKDNVPQHIMEKIRIKYINMELFDPNNVKKVNICNQIFIKKSIYSNVCTRSIFFGLKDA